MKIKCPDCQVVLERDAQRYRCPRCSLHIEIAEDKIGELKRRLRELKSSLGGFSLRDLKRIIGDPQHPATAMLIGFAAWGVTYFLRFPIFMAVLLALSLLLGPWGLVLMVVLPLVYRAHREAIGREAEKLAQEKDGPPR